MTNRSNYYQEKTKSVLLDYNMHNFVVRNNRNAAYFDKFTKSDSDNSYELSIYGYTVSLPDQVYQLNDLVYSTIFKKVFSLLGF